MRHVDTDVVVVGSGGAGLRAAQEASCLCRVTLLSKGFAAFDGATVTAQADIAVESSFCRNKLGLNGNADDNCDVFAEDMLREGEYLGDGDLVRVHVENSGEEVLRLKEKGLSLQGLVQNPGHSYPRSVWVSGVELSHLLKKEVKDSRSIDILDCTVLIDILLNDGQATGVIAFDILRGEPLYISSKSVVLCCGGAMGLYPFVTAPDGLTGDGMAAAYRAGAELVDMEFPMFLPYSVLKPDIIAGVTFTHDLAMTLDAHALNREGTRYMGQWDPKRLEHTTRDVNAAAAGYEIFNGRGSKHGGIYLSLKHIPDDIVEYSSEWLPGTISGWRCGGFDLKEYLPDVTRNAIETIPACHFWNGGIKININGSTSIHGLFAGGEGTGSIHGANRISGNGIAQALVWGAIAGKSAARMACREKKAYIPTSSKMESLCAEKTEFVVANKAENPVSVGKEIREKAWNNIGLIRTGESLSEFWDDLSVIEEKIRNQGVRKGGLAGNRDWLLIIQNRNIFDIAKTVCSSALVRKESRGAHFRYDYQETDDAVWVKNTVVSQKDGKPNIESVAAKNDRARVLPYAKRKYGTKVAIER